MKEKIGIWGFGTVGAAALRYCSAYTQAELEVLDRRILTDQEQAILKQHSSTYIPETDITSFLERNTFIIPSPGIDLRSYTKYSHKWLTELTLFNLAWRKPLIAVTGTVGKTSLVHLLAQVLAQYTKKVAVGGNIGTSMLDLLPEQPHVDLALLELSSFQLEYTITCAPTLALWTNFYPNHLDRHSSLEHYFQAKYQLIAHQTLHQYTLVPLELRDQLYNHKELSERPLAFFTEQPINSIAYNKLRPCDVVYASIDTSFVKYTRNRWYTLINKKLLPALSYSINWLMITAACDLLDLPIDQLERLPTLTLPHHRLDIVATIGDVTFYNDSKSTIAQATLAAVASLRTRPIHLFLGGLSKGVDRRFFIDQLRNQVASIVCFGTEAEQLYTYCKQAGIPASCHSTLETAFQACIMQARSGDCVLFSPAGASYDLFKNYQERGDQFVQLVKYYQQQSIQY